MHLLRAFAGSWHFREIRRPKHVSRHWPKTPCCRRSPPKVACLGRGPVGGGLVETRFGSVDVAAVVDLDLGRSQFFVVCMDALTAMLVTK